MIRQSIRTLSLCIFLIVAAISTTSYAQQGPQAVFDRANEQLQSGQYRQAISGYQQLEENRHWSGPLFLNLGISYQRIDSLGKAKYYFLKAATFEETEIQAQEALNFINSRFSHQSAKLPKLPWDVATDWLIKHIGAVTLLAWAVILLNIGVLIFIARWFFRDLPAYTSTIGLSIIGLALLISLAGFYTHYVDNRYSQAVMITQESPVVQHPNKQASLVSQAFEGYTFTVDHRKSSDHPGWSYVRMSNGLYGWIPNSEILIL